MNAHVMLDGQLRPEFVKRFKLPDGEDKLHITFYPPYNKSCRVIVGTIFDREITVPKAYFTKETQDEAKRLVNNQNKRYGIPRWVC